MFCKRTVALVASVALLAVLPAQAADQTGPVLHLDGETVFFTVSDPDTGHTLVAIFEGNAGDILRFETTDDGVMAQVQSNDALLGLFDRDPLSYADAQLLAVGAGSGSYNALVTIDPDTGFGFETGERIVVEARGELASPASTFSIRVQLVIVQQAIRHLIFETESLD